MSLGLLFSSHEARSNFTVPLFVCQGVLCGLLFISLTGAVVGALLRKKVGSKPYTKVRLWLELAGRVSRALLQVFNGVISLMARAGSGMAALPRRVLNVPWALSRGPYARAEGLHAGSFGRTRRFFGFVDSAACDFLCRAFASTLSRQRSTAAPGPPRLQEEERTHERHDGLLADCVRAASASVPVGSPPDDVCVFHGRTA